MAQIDFNAADLELNRAVKLSVIEIVAGSIGHGLKIPLTGYFLSLNQIYFLANALNKDNLPRKSLIEISGITAVLKSLSVAGQKIGPMLSIFIQGSLFYGATLLLGTGLPGQILAAILTAMWSFIQTVLSYILIFGFDYIGMINYLNTKLIIQNFQLGHFILLIILTSVLLKVGLAIGLVLLSYFKKSEIHLIKDIYLQSLKSHLILSKNEPENSVWRMAFKDICKPFFILNLVLMFIFIYNINQSIHYAIWAGIRSLGFAYLFFFCLRNPRVRLFLKSRFTGFYVKSEKVLAKFNEF